MMELKLLMMRMVVNVFWPRFSIVFNYVDIIVQFLAADLPRVNNSSATEGLLRCCPAGGNNNKDISDSPSS